MPFPTPILRKTTIRRTNPLGSTRVLVAEWYSVGGQWRVTLTVATDGAPAQTQVQDGQGADLQAYLFCGAITAKRRTLFRALDALIPA
jgi:hypothetical protein